MTCQHFVEAISAPGSSYGDRSTRAKKCRYNLPWQDAKKCDQFPYRGRDDSGCWNM